MPRKLRKSAGVTREDIEMLESLPPAISSPGKSINYCEGKVNECGNQYCICWGNRFIDIWKINNVASFERLILLNIYIYF